MFFIPMSLKAKIFPLLFAGLCACGGDYYYEEAGKLDGQKLFLRAAENYARFAEKKPEDRRAPMALYRAAEIYSRELGLCSKAAPIFEKLLKNHPSFPFRAAAMKDLFICPDYFPADRPMRWTYGDSETGGANARQLVTVADWGARGSRVTTRIYAGKTLVTTLKKNYRFRERDFVEKSGGFDTIILKYPLEKGLFWTAAPAGRKTRFTVEETGLSVKVRAGEFGNCVKVKQAGDGAPSWIYEYYAPWTGKILTSVAGKDFENRVTELLEYENTQKQ